MEIVVSNESDIVVFCDYRQAGCRIRSATGRAAQPVVRTTRGKKLIFDLEGLDYISSAGLRVFLTTAKKMKARDGKLCMARLRDNVKDVFTISGFIALIPAFDTLGAAQDAVK